MNPPLHVVESLPLPGHHDSRPLNDRERYAVAIWAWTRAHPGSSFDEFMAMIDRVERLALRQPV